MPTFHGIDNMWLRSPYSIDIEEMEDGSRVVYFNSEIHTNKRTRIGPSYDRSYTYVAIFRDALPRIMRQFGNDIVHCPHCGA